MTSVTLVAVAVCVLVGVFNYPVGGIPVGNSQDGREGGLSGKSGQAVYGPGQSHTGTLRLIERRSGSFVPTQGDSGISGLGYSRTYETGQEGLRYRGTYGPGQGGPGTYRAGSRGSENYGPRTFVPGGFVPFVGVPGAGKPGRNQPVAGAPGVYAPGGAHGPGGFGSGGYGTYLPQSPVWLNPENVVASSVVRSSDQHFSKHGTVIFDSVITNINGGYNPANGVFTAPVPGCYSITYHVETKSGSRKPAHVDLTRNGVVINSAKGQGDYATPSNSAVLILKQYDQISLQGRAGTAIGCAKNGCCSLSVALVKVGKFTDQKIPRAFRVDRW